MAGSHVNVSCTHISCSLGISMHYCRFVMLFDSLISFNYSFEREATDTKITFKPNDS